MHRKHICVLLWVSTVTESTRCYGALDECLQILSTVTFSLSDFVTKLLKGSHYTFCLHCFTSPLFLTCPIMLLSTDLLLKRSHNDHLIACTMALPFFVFDVLVALNVGVLQSYVLSPLLNFLSILDNFLDNLIHLTDTNITCSLIASPFSLLPSC